jgi:porphobilinogen synthase
VRALKKQFPQLVVITDVCMCEYTDHGHCGILRDGEVDNDATLELLARAALAHAAAGADIVAPSDMMDGRVGAIRRALDDQQLTSTAILAYAAKPPSRRRSRATGAAIRWMRRTPMKRCAKCGSTSRRAPTP